MSEIAVAGGHSPPAESMAGPQCPAPVVQVWSPARLAYAFYGVAATGAVVGQVWVALQRIEWSPGLPVAARVAAVLPFALCIELLAMALAAMADERARLGERAYGLRVFSAVVAVLAVSIIVAGHWPHLYLTTAFGALSGSAYLLWLLHSAARRRDALRAAGVLDTVAPAYGWYRRLRHPVLTARAGELARASRGELGLHASLRAAELALRAEARRPALAAAVEKAVRADHDDPLRAEIEARTLDLDAIARELEARADYGWWADRLAPARTRRADIPDAAGADIPADTNADMSARRRRGGQGTRAVRARAAGTDSVRASAAQRVAVVLAQDPDITRVELARRVGTSVRHVRRLLAARSAAGADGHVDVRADGSGPHGPGGADLSGANGHPAS